MRNKMDRSVLLFSADRDRELKLRNAIQLRPRCHLRVCPTVEHLCVALGIEGWRVVVVDGCTYAQAEAIHRCLGLGVRVVLVAPDPFVREVLFARVVRDSPHWMLDAMRAFDHEYERPMKRGAKRGKRQARAALPVVEARAA